MKTIRNIIFAASAILLAASLSISCSKEENVQANNEKAGITVSIDGELGALAQIDDTKSSLTNPITLKWIEEDKVYAFDGVKCLGALDVTLKEGKDYYALLSGELDAPAEGTAAITLVHATGFSATKGEAITGGNLSFDLSSQSGAVATAPFVAYASMEYEEGKTSFDKLVVNFTFATSIIRINCSGMEASKNFTTIISGMSNECVLAINGDGVSVGTGTTGNISLASATTNAQGTRALYAGLARTASKTDVSVVTTQDNNSYEGAIVNGSAWAAKTAYNAICQMTEKIIPPYVEIPAKYDGEHVTTLKWYRQNLAISESGKKTWKPGGSAVKVPGTGEDVINGDYFQWAAYEGYCQVEGQTEADRGLLIYKSFTSKMTDGSEAENAFDYKIHETGKNYFFNHSDEYEYIGISPYYDKTTSTYTMYTDEAHATLDRTGEYTGHNDDVANIILGGSWRMPTSAEFQAMYDATTWTLNTSDKGFYVTEKGVQLATDKSNALLFFPAAGYGGFIGLNYAGNTGYYWWSSLYLSDPRSAYTLNLTNIFAVPHVSFYRYHGLTVRPVSD